MSISLVPIALTTNKAPIIEPKKTGPIIETYQLSQQAFLGCGIAGLAIGSIWGFVPVEIIKLTGNPNFVGYFLATYLAGGFVAQTLIGRLAGNFGFRDLLTFCSLLATTMALLGTRLSPESSNMAILGIAFGFGAMSIPIYSLGVAHANEKAELENYDDFITTSSNLLLVMGVGAALGPLITSSVAKTIGQGYGIFYSCSIVFGILFLICLKKSRGSSKLQVEDQSDYVPVNANLVHPEIDPRS